MNVIKETNKIQITIGKCPCCGKTDMKMYYQKLYAKDGSFKRTPYRMSCPYCGYCTDLN